MFDQVERKAKSAAKSVALSAVGGILVVIGLAFLTVAAWIYLSVVQSNLIAALIIGLVYCGIGVIFIGLAKSAPAAEPRQSAKTEANDPPPATKSPPLMQAFLHGLQAGADAKRG